MKVTIGKRIGLAIIAILQVVFFSSAQALIIKADADGYAEGQDISDVFTGMTLSSIGRASGLDGRVYSYSDTLASTGTMVFGHNLSNHTEWYFDAYPEPHHPDDFALRIDFLNPAKMIAVDAVCNSELDIARILAYDSHGLVVGYTWSYPDYLMSYGDVWMGTISLESYDIAYVIVGGIFGNLAHAVVLDNVTADIIPEPATVLLLGLGGLAILRRKK